MTANFTESFSVGSVISGATNVSASSRNGQAISASAAARNVRRR
jgi:hypothetical protein